MKQSTFNNPHGLPNLKNISNPYDVSLLISHCLKIEIFKKIISTKVYSIWVMNMGIKREVIWENTNKLLRREGFIGVKTGVTVTAGPCLATCYESNNKIFIVVLLRTNKLSRRFK
jgi:D-alanyl-D-alanine carboxypeptidase